MLLNVIHVKGIKPGDAVTVKSIVGWFLGRENVFLTEQGNLLDY